MNTGLSKRDVGRNSPLPPPPKFLPVFPPVTITTFSGLRGSRGNEGDPPMPKVDVYRTRIFK